MINKSSIANIPFDIRPFMDGRELIKFWDGTQNLYWDVPSNEGRTSKVVSVMETDSHFSVWCADPDEVDIYHCLVPKANDPLSALEWVPEKDLFRYLVPVEWSLDQSLNDILEAALRGMPDKARDSFVHWAKSVFENRYPSAQDALVWIQANF